MTEPPNNHQLAREIAVLEERMNTHQTDYKTALERMERRMAERDNRMAERDKSNTRWTLGVVFAVTGIIIGAIAVLD